ncbi:hypothetical protein AB0J74_33865 [Asanoa sp. NPDC049573]|uniref:hypothetical protein n=1 Tax=Asanoa sp. NPDC049573 TaxID=3155396 RepID=UPI003417747B
MDESPTNEVAGGRTPAASFLNEAELDERLRAARDAALRRRSERLRSRATLAATRCAGLQERHATKLARLDRQFADLPESFPPPS